MTNEKIANYYDAFLPHLERDTRIANQRHVMIFTTLDKFTSYRTGDEKRSVLDLGCGVGVSSLYMAKRNCLVTAVDLAPKLIDFARANMAHTNIEYLCHDATGINLCKQFDIITLCDVFEHIPTSRISALMQVIKKHSHKDTVIYLNIPDGRFISYMLTVNPSVLQIVDNPYRPQDILDYFETIGFQALEINSRGIELPAQYTEYIFVRNERLREIYDEHVKPRQVNT